MSQQIFPYTNHSRFEKPDIYIKGENDCVWTNDGKKYIDCNSGLWNVNFGYNNPAYKTELDLHFYPTHFWSSTVETEDAASAICKWFGYNKVFFGHSGSDAIDTAIYISKFTNNKSNILALKQGFHGTNTQAHVYEAYTALIDAVNSDTSAVLIEPLMITKGVIEFDTGALKQLFALKEQFNFNIIFDETVTALGRGDYSQDWKPDILIASKGLTNGTYPLSAVLVNKRISDHIKNTDAIFSHGYTMSGNPQASVMLMETIKLVNKTNISLIQNKFKELLDTYSLKYTNKGLVFGIHVEDGIYTRRVLHKKGFLIRQHGNTLLFIPMFTADVSQYTEFCEIISTL